MKPSSAAIQIQASALASNAGQGRARSALTGIGQGMSQSLDGLEAELLEIRNRLDVAIKAVRKLRRAPPPQPRAKPFRVKPNTNASAIVEVLERAGSQGALETEIVQALLKGPNPRMASSKDPRRLVHWELYNMSQHADFLTRDKASKRWRITGPVPRGI